MPSSRLDRQAKIFQMKIQQCISMKDEEIDRLHDRLLFLKSGILAAKTRFSELDRQIGIERNRADAARNGNIAYMQSVIASKQAQHEKLLKDIHANHAIEIDTIQSNFQEQLERVNHTQQELLIAQTKRIDEEILQVRNTITECELSREKVITENEKTMREIEEENAQEFERSIERIRALEQIIETKNKERIEGLVAAKAKLSESISMIERMEDKHIDNIKSWEKRSDKIDETYQTELAELLEGQEHGRQTMEVELSDARKRVHILERALAKLKLGHREDMKRTQLELDHTSLRCKSVRIDENMNNQEMDKLTRRKSKMEKSRSLLSQKEQHLAEIRHKNADLHRACGALRHDVKFRRL